MNEDQADDADQPADVPAAAVAEYEKRAYRHGYDDGQRAAEQLARWHEEARDSDRVFRSTLWGYGLILLAVAALMIADKHGLLDPIFDTISREKIDA